MYVIVDFPIQMILKFLEMTHFNKCEIVTFEKLKTQDCHWALFVIFVGRKQKEEEEELERILQLSLTEK